MRHNVKKARLGRNRRQRKALVRSQLTALVTHGKLTTTATRAKEIARQFDQLVTTVKRQPTTREQIRTAKTVLYTEEAQRKLINGTLPELKNTSGHLSRKKIGIRPGDGAPLVEIKIILNK